MSHFARPNVLLLLPLLLLVGLATARAQGREDSLRSEISALRSVVQDLAEHQRNLEARITVLEQAQGATQTTAHTPEQVEAARDEIVNRLNDLAAHTFQYRIRPTAKGGGGGTFTGYVIPKTLATTEQATYVVEVSAESIVVTGMWLKGNGSVRATLISTGMLTNFIYGGEFK